MAFNEIKRPAGQSLDYRFFKGNSGVNFKAKQELSVNTARQPLLIISVSEVDIDGKAVLDATGEPVVTYHNHVLTDAELNDPAFDPVAVRDRIMGEKIAEKEINISNRAKLAALDTNWKK